MPLMMIKDYRWLRCGQIRRRDDAADVEIILADDVSADDDALMPPLMPADATTFSLMIRRIFLMYYDNITPADYVKPIFEADVPPIDYRLFTPPASRSDFFIRHCDDDWLRIITITFIIEFHTIHDDAADFLARFFSRDIFHGNISLRRLFRAFRCAFLSMGRLPMLMIDADELMRMWPAAADAFAFKHFPADADDAWWWLMMRGSLDWWWGHDWLSVIFMPMWFRNIRRNDYRLMRLLMYDVRVTPMIDDVNILMRPWGWWQHFDDAFDFLDAASWVADSRWNIFSSMK